MPKLPPSENGSSNEERAARYIRTMPPAVAGENGHDRLFAVTCRLVHGFGLTTDRAMVLLQLEYNPRCLPPWSDSELRYKCDQASNTDTHQKPKNHLGGDESSTEYTWKPGDNGSADVDGKKKSVKKPIMVPAADVLAAAMLAIGERRKEILFNCGSALSDIEVGPGKLTVIGAPPGTGKTSLASQILFASLEHHPELAAVIANAEMDPETLMRRELSRQAGVSYQRVRFASFSDIEEEQLFDAATVIQRLAGRIRIMQPPYDMDRLCEGTGDVPGLVIVDYLQKFRSGGDAIEGIEMVMGQLRFLAQHGWAVLALSSTARQQGKGGKHDHKTLDMGSFRGSGEIEFQADAAYVLRDQSAGADGDKLMELDCVKNRHGPRKSLELLFLVEEMRFESQVQPDPDLNAWNDEDF